MKLIAWGLTDTGRKRSHNEDSFLVDVEAGLFAVADGMGGHRGGATASRMAMEVMRRRVHEAISDLEAAAKKLDAMPSVMAYADTGVFVRDETDTAPVLPMALRDTRPNALDVGLEPTLEFGLPAAVLVMQAAAEEACQAIFEAAAADPNLHGMGTTLTAMLYDQGRMHMIHAGDSRAYLFRNGTLEQLTEDHTWIAEQLKCGAITEDEARTSKYRHVITRSVGFEARVELDAHSMAVEAGDCFVLCSDGMSNHLDNADIERVLKDTWYRHVPEKLVEMANERGGDDNITVVVTYAANDSAGTDDADTDTGDADSGDADSGDADTVTDADAPDIDTADAPDIDTADTADIDTADTADIDTADARAEKTS